MQQKIDRLFAFVVTDDDGSEGIIGMQAPESNMMVPFIGADMDRVKSLAFMANIIAKKVNKEYRILEFSTRKDVTEEYNK